MLARVRTCEATLREKPAQAAETLPEGTEVTTTIAFHSQLQVDRCRFTCTCFSEHKKKPTSCFRETFRLSLFPDWLMFELNKHGPVSVLKST